MWGMTPVTRLAARAAQSNACRSGPCYAATTTLRSSPGALLYTKRGLSSSPCWAERNEDRIRKDFREDAAAERAADKKYDVAAEKEGYDAQSYASEASKEQAVRDDFRQDAEAERKADKAYDAAAKKEGYNPSDYTAEGRESAEEKERDDFREDALAEREADEKDDAAARKAGFQRYPASFVLPTTVPHISRLASTEAEHRKKLLHLLNAINLPQFLYAFAYGSGVFSQAKMAKQQPGGVPPMIDMVIAVRNPAMWHARNMLTNPHHYPWWVRWGGHWALRKVQKMGAGIWYVPYVKSEGEVRHVSDPDYQVRRDFGGSHV